MTTLCDDYGRSCGNKRGRSVSSIVQHTLNTLYQRKCYMCNIVPDCYHNLATLMPPCSHIIEIYLHSFITPDHTFFTHFPAIEDSSYFYNSDRIRPCSCSLTRVNLACHLATLWLSTYIFILFAPRAFKTYKDQNTSQQAGYKHFSAPTTTSFN